MKAFNYISYSRLLNDAGSVNTAEHYRYCGTLPFTSIKGDVRPTADGGMIMCHDPGFTLDENGRVIKFDRNNCKLILEMTTAECLALEHAATFNDRHCKVTDLETYIYICKECGKMPFVTVRNEKIDAVASVVLSTLSKYGLIESSIINSFTVSTLETFRKMCPEIRLSNVLPFRKIMERSDVDTALALGNCLINCFHFTAKSPTEGISFMDDSTDAITYAASVGVDVYQAQVSDCIDIQELIRRGFSGAQMFFSPSEAN